MHRAQWSSGYRAQSRWDQILTMAMCFFSVGFFLLLPSFILFPLCALLYLTMACWHVHLLVLQLVTAEAIREESQKILSAPSVRGTQI